MPNQDVDAELQANSSVSATTTILVSASIVAGSSLSAGLSFTGKYGSDPYGTSPYGSIPGPMGVLSATSLTPTSVELEFSSLLDFTFGPIEDPANYSIPGLSVLAVFPESAHSVRLFTSAQTAILYTVTVTAARGVYGQSLDPSLRTAQFLGEIVAPTMTVVAVSPTKVRLIFDSEMLNDSHLIDPLNYSVEDMFGNSITVSSATPEQPSSITTVALVLAAPLLTQNTYQVTIDTSIKTDFNASIVPSTVAFYWVQEPEIGPIVIPLSQFTGEVSGGILGSPLGQVFFSPALNAPIANSVIQVDEVDVCTYAFDSYNFPQPIDPPPLYTFSKVYNIPGSILGPMGAVLWAPFPRNFEAQFNLSNSGANYNEMVPLMVDSACTAILQQTWNPSYVSLLNSPGWRTFEHLLGTFDVTNGSPTVPTTNDQTAILSANSEISFASQSGVSYVILTVTSSTITLTDNYTGTSNAATTLATTTPPVFICANNSAPIPPGTGYQILMLHTQLNGGATATVQPPHLTRGGRAHLTGNSLVDATTINPGGAAIAGDSLFTATAS